MKQSWNTRSKEFCSWGYTFNFELSTEQEAIDFLNTQSSHAWITDKIDKLFPVLYKLGRISGFEGEQMQADTEPYNISMKNRDDMESAIRLYLNSTKDISTLEFIIDIKAYIPGESGWEEQYIEKGATLTFWFDIRAETNYAFEKIPFASFDIYTELYDCTPMYAGGDNTDVALKNRPALKDFLSSLRSDLVMYIDDAELFYDPLDEKELKQFTPPNYK